LAALELVQPSFPVGEEFLREGLATVHWPGRFEVMLVRPMVILDGAHNGEGVGALIDALSEVRQGRRVKLLFAAMADKEWELMVRALAKAVDEIVFTRVGMARSAEPEHLAEKLSDARAHRVIRDPRIGLKALLDESQGDDVIVVAGSLYLLGEVRPMLEQIAAGKPSGAEV
jgi:dihydrofolate synthase/folylpolyglutamate synthase